MKAVAIEIVRFTRADQPGWVECALVDADGRRHVFEEKIPIVTSEELWSDSVYPRRGVFPCEVLAAFTTDDGRALAKIDPSRPRGFTTRDVPEEFVVLSSSVCDYEGGA